MAAPIREGEVLAGKYRVEQVLGQGGMGVVVAAWHQELAQRVALKMLLPEACQVPEAVGRFLREARAAVQIQSEHVARVTDVGRLDTGEPFMVMEHLRGSDLSDVVLQRGRLPAAEAVAYVLQASEAIAEAHSLGIIHRDLKPSNLFLTRRADGSPLVKVLDFGISKLTGGESGAISMTATSMAMGSPLYMSPEQIRSAKVVYVRTDIWALGVILYEFLSGRPPYQGESQMELLAQIVSEPPAPLRQHCPDVSVELEAVVMRCLQKDREARFANVAQLARALQPFAAEDGRTSVQRISRILGDTGLDAATVSVSASVPAPIPLPTAAPAGPTGPAGTTPAAWGRTGGSPRRRPALAFGLVVVSLGVVGLAVAGVWGFLRSPPLPDAEASAAAQPVDTEPPPLVDAPAVAPVPEVDVAPAPAPDTESAEADEAEADRERAEAEKAAAESKQAAAPARPVVRKRPAAVKPPERAPKQPVAPPPAPPKAEPAPSRRGMDLFDDTK